MWLTCALFSALFLGVYDVFKKRSLEANAVIPVLFLSTLFSSLLFLPLMLASALHPAALAGTFLFVPAMGWAAHGYILLKSCLVLGSWIFGYFGMKHLPLTIAGPINATRPVLVLLGAILVFGERLNPYQWAGVLLAAASFFLLSRSGKKEGIDFRHDEWIWFMAMASLLGAASGLYDKHLMAPKEAGGLGLDRVGVQSFYSLYQCALMGAVLVSLWYPGRRGTTPFRFSFCIVGISVFLSLADFAYFYALSLPCAMISVVSMLRRGSVLVSFLFGAIALREENPKEKMLDLALLLAGLFLLYLGSRS